jgi:zinc transport system substrate-binding protein
MTAILLFVIGLMLVYPFYNPNNTDNDKIRVTASFYPLYDIAKNIGKDKIHLTQLVPFGKGVHFFEPKPNDILNISNASIFFYGGAGIDPWASMILNGLPKKDFALQASSVVQLLKIEDEFSHNEHKEIDIDDETDEKEHSFKSYDPHFWLDFENMRKMVALFTKKISDTDPKNKKFYMQNAKEYIQQLQYLKETYDESLRNCKYQKVIVNHNAFRYLDKNYNFETIPITGLSPEAQPNPKVMSELIKLVKNDEVSTIFFESLSNEAIAQTVANETGANVSVLNPLGNIKQSEVPKGFFKLMEENLKNLKSGLECH